VPVSRRNAAQYTGGGDEIEGGPDLSERAAVSKSKAKPDRSEPGREIAPIPTPAAAGGIQQGPVLACDGRAGISFLIQRKPSLRTARERGTNGRTVRKVGFRPPQAARLNPIGEKPQQSGAKRFPRFGGKSPVARVSGFA